MFAKSLRIFVLAVFILTLAGRSQSVAAQAPLGNFIEGSRLVIRASNRPSTLHIPAPLQAGMRRSSGSATIIIDFIPDGVAGCAAFPADAQTAYQYAAYIWASLISVNVDVHISACWTAMGPDVLGSAGPSVMVRGYAGLPVPNKYYYPLALANNILGTDLDPSNPEIMSSFNSAFASWYFGTDGNPGLGEYDFVSVALHEIAHGLGFSGNIQVVMINNQLVGTSDPLMIFDYFTKNKYGVLLSELSASDLYAVLTGDNANNPAYFAGPHAVSANAGQMVRLFSPFPWKPGSSYSHLGENYNNTANAMMTFSLPAHQAVHDPGSVTLGIMADLGWPLLVIPAAPSSLSALAASTSQIDLTWQDLSNNETGFQVDRSTDGTAWVNIATTAADATSYPAVGLAQSTPYHFRVRAVNGTLGSAYSNSVVVSTLGPPAAPSALIAYAVDVDKVRLRWTDNSTNESGFHIERSDDLGSTWTPLPDVGPDVTVTTDTGLTNSTQYAYRITSFIGIYKSALLGPVNASTWALAYKLNFPQLTR